MLSVSKPWCGILYGFILWICLTVGMVLFTILMLSCTYYLTKMLFSCFYCEVFFSVVGAGDWFKLEKLKVLCYSDVLSPYQHFFICLHQECKQNGTQANSLNYMLSVLSVSIASYDYFWLKDHSPAIQPKARWVSEIKVCLWRAEKLRVWSLLTYLGWVDNRVQESHRTPST